MTRPALWLRGKVSTHPSAEGMMSVSDCPLWEPTVLRGIVVSSGAIPLCEKLDGRKNAVCAKSHTSPCEVRATSEDRHSSRPCQREGWPPPGSVVFPRLMRVPRYHDSGAIAPCVGRGLDTFSCRHRRSDWLGAADELAAGHLVPAPGRRAQQRALPATNMLSFIFAAVSLTGEKKGRLGLQLGYETQLRQVLTNLRKKLTRAEGLRYKVIAACHARFLLISAQGIGTDRNDRD
jgi:hypothetical protein